MSGLVILDDGAPPEKAPQAASAAPSPTADALTDLWVEAKRALYHPRNWFRLLTLRRRYNLRLMRYHEVRVKIPHGMLPDCPNCTEVCCTGPGARVSLRLIDIARLVDAGLDDHIVHDAPTTDYAKTAAEYEAQSSVFARTFPVLRRDTTSTCTLLDADRMCTAYPAWPLSCRRYPYSLDALRKEVFWAKGCGQRRAVRYTDASDAVRSLVDATVDAYNENIKDIVMLHVVPEALFDLGLLRYLQLDAKAHRGIRRRVRAQRPAADLGYAGDKS